VISNTSASSWRTTIALAPWPAGLRTQRAPILLPEFHRLFEYRVIGEPTGDLLPPRPMRYRPQVQPLLQNARSRLPKPRRAPRCVRSPWYTGLSHVYHLRSRVPTWCRNTLAIGRSASSDYAGLRSGCRARRFPTLSACVCRRSQVVAMWRWPSSQRTLVIAPEKIGTETPPTAYP